MKISKAATGARMVLEISPQERETAKVIKKEFSAHLKLLDKALKVVVDLRDAIADERPSKDDLKKKYRGKMLRFKRKVQENFNEFLSAVKGSLEKLSEISDPDTIKLREIMIAEIGEMSDGAEALIDLLEETDRDGFTKSLEGLVGQMEKRQKSIVDVIDDQLFNHIDHDILGKMKVSDLRFKIRRRARIIKQLTRGN